MPRGQKVSPHHRGRRKTHFLVRTSTIFGADVHDPKGCRKTLYKKSLRWFFVPYWGCPGRCRLALVLPLESSLLPSRGKFWAVWTHKPRNGRLRTLCRFQKVLTLTLQPLKDHGKGALIWRGVAFIMILAVLMVLAVLESTLPSVCLSYWDGLIRASRFADLRESPDSRESFQASRTEPLYCESRFGG